RRAKTGDAENGKYGGRPDRATGPVPNGRGRCNSVNPSNAHTTFPSPDTGCQPHRKLHDSTTCNPRPLSAPAQASMRTGGSLPGSVTRHIRYGTRRSMVSPIGCSPGIQRAESKPCRSELVTSSETTSSAAQLSSPIPQPCSVNRVNSRASRADSTPGGSEYVADGWS